MKKIQSNAFTLIELLVVISIIAILAGIALPVFNEVQTRGAQTKALANAKQIGLACKIFAGDYGGSFPKWTELGANKTLAAQGGDSNNVLDTLIPDYLSDKNLFLVPSSKFCQNATPVSKETLSAGENEWAYMLGLAESSDSKYPLLATGFADASGPGLYSRTDASVVGGVWKGKKAIVIRTDASGNIETCTKIDDLTSTVLRAEGESKSIFEGGDSQDGTKWFDPSSVFILNPIQPNL